MKKVLVFALLVVAMGFAARRMVVAEKFTNTGWPSCPTSNANLDACVTQFKDSLTVVRYHAWWPSSSDPWWVANQTENRDRVNYYAIAHTPEMKLDGIYTSHSYMADIRGRTRAPSRFTIRLNGWYNRSTRVGRLQAWVKNEGTGSYTGVFHRVIVEDSTMYSGYYQNQAMRKMYPNASGVTLTIPAGDSVLKDTTFSISAGWRQDSCMIVVFLQNTRAQGDTMQQGAQLRVKGLLAIEEEGGGVYPQNISLALRSANPFSRFLDIGFAVPKDEAISLKIYNSSGQLVRTLVDGITPHGYRTARFDASGMPAGVYVVMLRDRESTLTQKITLVK